MDTDRTRYAYHHTGNDDYKQTQESITYGTERNTDLTNRIYTADNHTQDVLWN